MQTHISATADTQFTKLQAFRQAAYACLGNGRAALFDLADAVLATPAVNSFAELACAPVFRRRWASLYEALQDGRPDRAALLRLYVQQLPPSGRVLVAGDHTDWPRLAAPTLRDRKIVHAPTKIAGNRPITIGYDFSTVSWVPEWAGSWAPPLLFERISSAETPLQKGAEQLRRISRWCRRVCASCRCGTVSTAVRRLSRRRTISRPISCFDCGPTCVCGARHRPIQAAVAWPGMGQRSSCASRSPGGCLPASWNCAIQNWAGCKCWSGACCISAAADQPLVVVRIERLEAAHTARDPGVLWLGWHGAEPPPLATWWDWYLRRFAVDHWHRFAKQDLHWTLPHLATPEQAERWSDLMPLLTRPLWLARPLVNDVRWPWQKPQAAAHRTPGRVRQGMAGLLAAIGTPAPWPKPRGKAPGWPTGRVRKRHERYEVVKKAHKKPKAAT